MVYITCYVHKCNIIYRNLPLESQVCVGVGFWGKNMEILGRKAAKLAKSNIYYTGKPCSNGHITYRYVLSGSCSDCVNPKNGKTKGIKDELSIIKLRLFPANVESMALTAYGMLALRYPDATPADVITGRPPTWKEHSGTALYTFYCHPDDFAALLAASISITKQPLDIERIRASAINSGTELANKAE